MGPNKGGAPNGAISEVIDSTFGDFRTFKAKFKESALDLFGSGWTFLMVNQEGKVQIHNFPNQECPLSKGLKPVLLIDVWEHAYYLQFRNRRAEWVDAWWNVVNWDAVNALYLGREVLRLAA